MPLSYRLMPGAYPPDEPPRTPSMPHPSVSSQEYGVLRGKQVVIVEDEGVTQMQLRTILTRAGMVVAGSARTGEEGLDLVLRERPDIVLMDIKMPGPYDGLEAARRILAQFRTCVVMLTAYEEHREEAQALGSCGYVVKPMNSASLLPELERAYLNFLPH